MIKRCIDCDDSDNLWMCPFCNLRYCQIHRPIDHAIICHNCRKMKSLTHYQCWSCSKLVDELSDLIPTACQDIFNWTTYGMVWLCELCNKYDKIHINCPRGCGAQVSRLTKEYPVKFWCGKCHVRFRIKKRILS